MAEKGLTPEKGITPEAKLDLIERVRDYYDQWHHLGVAILDKYIVAHRDVFIGGFVGTLALGALATYVINSETINTANEASDVAAQVVAMNPGADTISVNTTNDTVTFLTFDGTQLERCEAVYGMAKGSVPTIDNLKCNTFVRVP